MVVAWRRGHSRSFSSPPSRAPLLRPSRLVGVCLLASTLLATYWLHAEPAWLPGVAVGGERIAFEYEQGWEGVMGGGNVTRADKAVQSTFLGSVEPVEDASTGLQDGDSRRDELDLVGKVALDLAVPLSTAQADVLKTLPVCQKTVLFRFAGLHGFGSEVTLLLRIAALAEHYGYTLILDSSAWNYGTWADYFLPFPLPSTSVPCRPPREDSIKRYKLVLTINETLDTAPSPAGEAPFKPNWTKRDQVVWSSRDMDGVDATVLRLFANGSSLSTLHEQDMRQLERGENGAGAVGFLSSTETVPPVFEPVFEKLSALVKEVWRSNADARASMELLRARVRVGGRHEEEKRIGDLVVAVHVRLGDKVLEAAHIGPVTLAPNAAAAASRTPPTSPSPPGLNTALLTWYFSAAIDSINSLLSLPPVSSAFSSLPRRTTSEGKRVSALLDASAPWQALVNGGGGVKPTLVLMSDDAAAVEAFRRHPLAKLFRIVGTADGAAPSPPPPPPSLPPHQGGVEVEEDLPVDELKKRKAGGMKRIVKGKKEKRELPHPQHGRKPFRSGVKWHHAPLQKTVPPGFNENTFNALPLASRVSSTQVFVRDLTVLAQEADAVVMTGSSNVGRLMVLLFEAARRERGERGKREVRSLDTRWFPTARFS
ncbi:hypothetical protein JCM8547_005468 [Rhodosporidiobolus lusitaniae]